METIRFSLPRSLQPNEALLNDYLFKTLKMNKKKLLFFDHFLEGFRGTVFRQTMFAEFEHDIHVRAKTVKL